MSFPELIRHFSEDPTVVGLAALVALDIVLGVCSALAAGRFRVVLLADFLKTDVLMKLVPYFGVWAAVHLGGDFFLGDFGIIEETTGAAAVLAVGASVLNSLRELGLNPRVRVVPEAVGRLPDVIASDDPLGPG